MVSVLNVFFFSILTKEQDWQLNRWVKRFIIYPEIYELEFSVKELLKFRISTEEKDLFWVFNGISIEFKELLGVSTLEICVKRQSVSQLQLDLWEADNKLWTSILKDDLMCL